MEANNRLADSCEETNFPFINNSKRMKAQHFNNSKFLVIIIAKKLSKFLNDIHVASKVLMKIILKICLRSIKEMNVRIS